MTFDYKDINLIPKMCIVDSRSECDTSVILGKYKFNLPIIPANMESVINEELAIKLAHNNFFYIKTKKNLFDFFILKKKVKIIFLNWNIFFQSVGVRTMVYWS